MNQNDPATLMGMPDLFYLLGYRNTKSTRADGNNGFSAKDNGETYKSPYHVALTLGTLLVVPCVCDKLNDTIEKKDERTECQ